jgi:hypothetical protein
MKLKKQLKAMTAKKLDMKIIDNNNNDILF